MERKRTRAGPRTASGAGTNAKTGPQRRRGERDGNAAGEVTVGMTGEGGPVAHNRIRIVGIGASAGGLDALGELLENLPVDTGMGFVVVQHLDPDHKSELATLLKKRSPLPVEEVSGNLTVAPNRVYVLPADRSLSFADGVLELKARAKAPAVYHAIDAFLESLAADRGPHAIGVVLSGKGSDGTLGLEAIKAADGVTFAQDDTAKYTSMPHSATAAGCVDFVLSPTAIAEELARIARLAPGESIAASAPGTQPGGAEDASTTQAGYDQIRRLLRSHAGVDFSGYKSSTFERRVNRRIMLGKLNTLADYVRALEDDAAELSRLLSDVLIHVTSFFRNPESFDYLKQHVITKLMAESDGETVRLWSLGCSTGQEAYSLAIACAEAAEETPGAPTFQIFASDLNAAIIAKARTGFFANDAVENLSPERLRRFFVEEHGGYRISKALRGRVVFAHQNALSDPPFSRLDLIACRNMLIYLNPRMQQKVMPTFHYALKPGGYLFLGSAESAATAPKLFEVVDKRHRIFRRKTGESGKAMLATRPTAGTKKIVAPQPLPAGLESRSIDVLRESDRVTLNRFAPSGALVDEAWHVLQFRGDTSAWLKAPAGKASFDVIKMAREGLAVPLRTALEQARQQAKVVRTRSVRVGPRGSGRTIDLEVIPLKNTKERCFLVFFIETGQGRDAPPPPPPALPTGDSSIDAMAAQITALEHELGEARDYLLSFQQQVEADQGELQSSNEEVTSANEELQSLNEELETSKEEIESANEELITVNEEMSERNQTLAHLNSDLVNLQASAHLTIVLLGRDQSIRRFTEQAARQFNLKASDVGRPFNRVRHNLEVPDLAGIIDQVIETTREHEAEVQNKDGRWSLLRVRPYLTLDQKIDGAVLVVEDVEALKRSEQQAKTALEHAQSTLDTVRTPLLVLDGDLRIVSANLSFYQLFAVAPRDVVGQPYQDLGGNDWADSKLRDLLQDTLAQRTDFRDHEIEHDFKHLGRRRLLLDGCRMENPAPGSKRILLAIEDVTQRRAEETELREHREQFARIFNQTAAGIVQTDPTGRFTLMNDRFCQIAGRTREELLTLDMQAITHPEDRQEDTQSLADLVAGKIPQFVVEKRYVRPDGSVVWVHHEVAAIRAADRSVQSVAAVVTDITQRRQSEAALRYQTLLLRTLSDTAAQLLTAESPRFVFDVIFGRLAHVLGAELYFIHLLSAEEDKLVLENSMGLDAEQRAQLHELVYTRANDEPPAVGSDSWHLPTYDPLGELREQMLGRTLGVQAHACHPLRVGNRFLGTLSVASARREKFDAEELRFMHATCDLVATSMERARLTREAKEAREMAEHANIAKDNFFAALSHELRTPLNPVLLMASEGASNPALPEEVRRDFATIQINVAMEARLIDDLLDLTRITHGKLTVEQETVDLGAALQSAIDVVRTEINAKELKLKFQRGPGEHVVSGDPVRLQQIFWNVLRNAVKFTPAGGSIEIETFVRPGNRLEIAITDSGMGMSQPELARIFEPYSQGDHAGTAGSRQFSGIGMGLAISRMLTELHGGTIQAESAGMGQGSTFRIDLPLLPPAATKAPGETAETKASTTTPAGPVPPAPQRKRILVVEDHDATRAALSRLLTNWGYDVTGAGSLAQARSAAESSPFDLLVSDIGLPDGSGHELMMEMRERFGMKGIALTGYGMEDDIARARESGFASHLVKPITVRTLETALATATQ